MEAKGWPGRKDSGGYGNATSQKFLWLVNRWGRHYPSWGWGGEVPWRSGVVSQLKRRNHANQAHNPKGPERRWDARGSKGPPSTDQGWGEDADERRWILDAGRITPPLIALKVPMTVATTGGCPPSLTWKQKVWSRGQVLTITTSYLYPGLFVTYLPGCSWSHFSYVTTNQTSSGVPS